MQVVQNSVMAMKRLNLPIDTMEWQTMDEPFVTTALLPLPKGKWISVPIVVSSLSITEGSCSYPLNENVDATENNNFLAKVNKSVDSEGESRKSWAASAKRWMRQSKKVVGCTGSMFTLPASTILTTRGEGDADTGVRGEFTSTDETTGASEAFVLLPYHG